MYYPINQRLKKIPTKLIFLTDSLLLLLLLFNLFGASFIKESNFKGNNDLTAEIKLKAQKIVASCQGASSWDCYKGEFSKLTNEKDLVFAEKTLLETQDIDPFLRNCHIIAHAISQEVTRKDPSRWEDLMKQVNIYSCGGGFLHGILETHMADNPDFVITDDFVNNLCSSLKEDEKKRMCTHGLGHLILLEKEGNLSAALPICDGVTKDTTGMGIECFIGMFMEDHQKLALAEHGITKFPVIDQNYVNSLASDCLKYDGLTGAACWNEMAELYAKLYNYDPLKVYQNCNSAPTPEEKNRCYLKGVAVISVYLGFDTSDKLLSICQPYKDEGNNVGYKTCLNYIVTSLMYYSPKYIDRGITLCSNVEEGYKQDCFTGLLTQLKRNVASPSDREPFCQNVPEKYKPSCINS